MTTTHHPKIIVAAIVSGALALAAPAGASVLNPVTDSWNAGGPDVQTVNATVQQPSDQGDATSQFTALRRDGSKAEAFVANVGGTPVAHSGDGFDVADAGIIGLLVVTALLLGAGAIGRRRGAGTQPGGAVSQGA